jgi:hypothetical protein
MTPPSTTPLSVDLRTGTNDTSVPSPSRGLLACSLCQRQIPTWHFLPSTAPSRPLGSSGTRPHQLRAFDALREHRTHCPYVVKTTFSPSLALTSMPSIQKGGSDIWEMALSTSMVLLEGWRVHLNILVRYEQRKMLEYASVRGVEGNTDEENPAGGIIETVRTQHGGVSP